MTGRSKTIRGTNAGVADELCGEIVSSMTIAGISPQTPAYGNFLFAIIFVYAKL